MSPTVIQVATASRAYPVRVEAGLLARLDVLLAEAGVTAQRVVVSSPTVWKAHGAAVERALGGAEHLLVPDGERSKTALTVTRIYDALIRMAADRSVTIVAIGGGVIGDVVGFAAATYLRGVGLVHIPTTLLAQVDSSIGGKVGINHALGKNLIGSFHQPLAVFADPEVLGTLPRREFRAGLYEVVKYGMIADRGLFERVGRDLRAIVRRDQAALAPVIANSCRIKARVVSEDEREGGVRRILNFGHTAGHAIEAVTRYRRFRHGEAVAYGMLAVADLGVRRGVFAEAERSALANLVARLGPLPSINDLSAQALVETMRRDKKVRAGRLHVVLPTAIGATRIVDDVTDEEFARSLRAIGTRA
ncbi:MAG: 3-dehydroquinate synthase [Acidobacteria bacterium]|nr:3-dehydroquinate synthase [Acidobacteriota bacterium]